MCQASTSSRASKNKTRINQLPQNGKIKNQLLTLMLNDKLLNGDLKLSLSSRQYCLK